MHKVVIDQEKCIGCGACAADCVAANISVQEKKAVLRSETCIFCGHCEAICPMGAVELTGFADKTEEYEEQTRLDPKELLQAIRTRRTIRQFKDAEVGKGIIHQIIEAGRLAPTGGNSQSISYIILNKQKKEMEAHAVGMFRKLLGAGKTVIPMLKSMQIDDDFFFKKAPLVILICSSNKLDAGLAAENMAFMAEAHGLGVLYSGFFTMCANTVPAIKKRLGLGGKKKVVTTLVIGYPAVKYHRTVHREKANVKIY